MITRALAAGVAVLAVLAGFLWFQYSRAQEDIGRLEAERADLLASNRANVAAIDRLGQQIAERDALHRDLESGALDLELERDRLKRKLKEVDANAPEDFRDCLAVPLPAEYQRLQLDAG